MRIKNEEIYSMIAELWNAEACATDARERAWCVEAVQAEVRASGMTPYEALRRAVSAVCTAFAATAERCNRLEHPRFDYGWEDATDDDEDYADDADDDDVVYEEDDDGDGDYVDEENEEDEDGYVI